MRKVEICNESLNEEASVDEYLTSLAANDHMIEEYITTLSHYSESDITSDNESEVNYLKSIAIHFWPVLCKF